MICSAMFYKSEEDVNRPTVATIGPFTITMQELFVSCITAAIVFPVTLFITFVFRNSNKKDNKTKQRESKLQQRDENYVEFDDIDLLLGEMYKESVETESISDEQEAKEEKPSMLNLCCNKSLLISAWITANLAILASAFFVILYSMEWGSEKANAWLLSYVLSFIENAFLADPMKVSLKLSPIT